jgi:hypothetical protein
MGQNRPLLLRQVRAAFTRLRLGAVLAMLALTLQCFVIQTHVDGLAYAAPVQVSATAHASKSPPAVVCLICQQAALGRTATLAAPPAIHLVEHTLFLANAPLPLPVLETRPHRPWQSRAPPLSA